jgi:hypothetical protein
MHGELQILEYFLGSREVGFRAVWRTQQAATRPAPRSPETVPKASGFLPFDELKYELRSPLLEELYLLLASEPRRLANAVDAVEDPRTAWNQRR